ncbi:hypothetical protein ACMFMG_009834 [Clarireedia jacksonii]
MVLGLQCFSRSWSLTSVARCHYSSRIANLLIILRAIVNLVVILVLMPFANRCLLLWYRFPVRRRDTYLARASSLAILFGLAGIAIAPTAPILIFGVMVATLGFGVDALLRSLITSVISASEISIFYTAMTLLQNLGESAGGPLYAGLFSVALSFKKQWLGLLFWVAAGLAALLTIMFCNRQILDATVEDEE